jgi:hypothetical protein
VVSESIPMPCLATRSAWIAVAASSVPAYDVFGGRRFCSEGPMSKLERRQKDGTRPRGSSPLSRRKEPDSLGAVDLALVAHWGMERSDHGIAASTFWVRRHRGVCEGWH